jgi:ABC-type nitrate/sulfonate/bicarbonate transport system ATPase subunit
MKLTVDRIAFRYGKEPLFKGLSFDVAAGEFVSILGPSGCGKSTILNLLAGILTPESGEMRVDGAPIHGMSSHFAYMPQNDLLLPWKTIMQNVCLHGQIHGNVRDAQARAEALFGLFGLAGYENAWPGDLSGGMRQRAAFLRTALCDADILLLDEPFGALDVISRGDMQDWLVSMKRHLGRTCLLVTHDIDEAIFLSDRILVLGGKPAVIRGEYRVTEAHRTRDWLYGQTELRHRLHDSIRGLEVKPC